MSSVPLHNYDFECYDLYVEKRNKMGQNFTEVLEGEFRFSEHALGTQSLLSCCAIAIYTNGLAALAHAYSEPAETVSICRAPYQMRTAFEQRGHASNLTAKVSASSRDAFEIILDQLLKNNIRLTASYFHDYNQDSALYASTNVVFDVRTKEMTIFSSKGTTTI